jgi:hypothetical protein
MSSGIKRVGEPPVHSGAEMNRHLAAVAGMAVRLLF